MKPQLDESTMALIMTIARLVNPHAGATPAQVRQEYSRVIDQIVEYRKHPDYSGHD
jgi:hypothetical protein